MEREQIVMQVLSAATAEECQRAKSLIRDWMARHPGDYGMLDAGEQLAMMRDVAPGRELGPVVKAVDKLQPV